MAVGVDFRSTSFFDSTSWFCEGGAKRVAMPTNPSSSVRLCTGADRFEAVRSGICQDCPGQPPRAGRSAILGRGRELCWFDFREFLASSIPAASSQPKAEEKSSGFVDPQHWSKSTKSIHALMLIEKAWQFLAC